MRKCDSNMDNREIKKLIQRYIAGECSAEEKLLIEEWYKHQRAHSTADVTQLDIAAAQQKMWAKLQAPPVRTINYGWKIAAAVILLIGTGYLLYLLLFNTRNDWKEVYADNNKPYHLQLSDGSDIWLNAGTRLRYPAAFKGAERRIELITGEVCIHAAEDAQHPFIIKSGGIQTRVLGTIFNVRSYEQLSFVQVSVQEGKVAVTHADRNNEKPLLLLPDERATLYASQQTLVKDSVDAAAISGWTTDQLLFNNERLDMIAVLLENKYNVRISFADSTLPAYKVTAGFAAADTLKDVLEALSLANNLACKQQGNRIVFSKQQ